MFKEIHSESRGAYVVALLAANFLSALAARIFGFVWGHIWASSRVIETIDDFNVLTFFSLLIGYSIGLAVTILVYSYFPNLKLKKFRYWFLASNVIGLFLNIGIVEQTYSQLKLDIPGLVWLALITGQVISFLIFIGKRQEFEDRQKRSAGSSGRTGNSYKADGSNVGNKSSTKSGHEDNLDQNNTEKVRSLDEFEITDLGMDPISSDIEEAFTLAKEFYPELKNFHDALSQIFAPLADKYMQELSKSKQFDQGKQLYWAYIEDFIGKKFSNDSYRAIAREYIECQDYECFAQLINITHLIGETIDIGRIKDKVEKTVEAKTGRVRADQIILTSKQIWESNEQHNIYGAKLARYYFLLSSDYSYYGYIPGNKVINGVSIDGFIIFNSKKKYCDFIGIEEDSLQQKSTEILVPLAKSGVKTHRVFFS